MSRRWVRFAIVLVALAGIVLAGLRFRDFQQVIDNEEGAKQLFADLSWTLALTLADLRAAQQGYVATGQNPSDQIAAVDTHLNTARGSLADLKQLATGSAAVGALDVVEAALVDLEQVDQRAREHIELEQPLLASDLVFTEGMTLAAGAAGQIERARTTERAARTAAVRDARSEQTKILAAGAGAGLLALLLLAGGRGPAAASAPEGTTEDYHRALDLRTIPTAGKPAARDPQPDLRSAASLCSDLSALSDTSALPILLARAAEVMNASGLIVWVYGSDGHRLIPAIGHGYSAKSLAELGSIPEDGSNATAVAFYSEEMQIVDGDESDCGALAIPLRSADGCVGVLSAELRDGWESNEVVQASATMIGAQLATLLPPDRPAGRPAVPATGTATGTAQQHS